MMSSQRHVFHQFVTHFKQAPNFHDSAKKLIVLGWLDSYSKGCINKCLHTKMALSNIYAIYLSEVQTVIFSSIPSNKNGEI